MRIRNKSTLAIAALMLVALVAFLGLYVDRNDDHALLSDGQDIPFYGPVSDVFDNAFDDSWIDDMPEYIGGYKLDSITTPRTHACHQETVFNFQARQETVEEYLETPMDHASLRAGITRLIGREIDFDTGFGYGGTRTPEEETERLFHRNRSRIENGCAFYSWGPIRKRRGDE